MRSVFGVLRFAFCVPCFAFPRSPKEGEQKEGGAKEPPSFSKEGLFFRGFQKRGSFVQRRGEDKKASEGFFEKSLQKSPF